MFRKLRDGISLNQSENVEKNVRLYIDSIVKGYKNIGYIAIYWPLKNEVDIRNLKNFTNFIAELKQKGIKFKIIRHEDKRNAFTQKILRYFKND